MMRFEFAQDQLAEAYPLMRSSIHNAGMTVGLRVTKAGSSAAAVTELHVNKFSPEILPLLELRCIRRPAGSSHPVAKQLGHDSPENLQRQLSRSSPRQLQGATDQVSVGVKIPAALDEAQEVGVT